MEIKKVYKSPFLGKDMAVNFIRKIWLDNADEKAHAQFIRFSRGTFENRAVISINKSKIIKLRSTFEFANDFVLFLAELPNVNFSGVILSRENLGEIFLKNGVEIDESKKKGLFVYITRDVSSKTVAEIKDKIYCMLLDAEAPGISLKTKKKLPKPGKSGAEKIDGKFCILELDEKFYKQFHEDFLFGLPYEFKKAKVRHTFVISDIILPKGEKDFERIRLDARKKGKIIRQAEVDGNIIQQEKAFEA